MRESTIRQARAPCRNSSIALVGNARACVGVGAVGGQEARFCGLGLGVGWGVVGFGLVGLGGPGRVEPVVRFVGRVGVVVS